MGYCCMDIYVKHWEVITKTYIVRIFLFTSLGKHNAVLPQ